jgi:hypothetical protein
MISINYKSTVLTWEKGRISAQVLSFAGVPLTKNFFLSVLLR